MNQTARPYRALWTRERPGPKIRAEEGRLEIGDDCLSLVGETTFRIPYGEIKRIDLCRSQLGTAVVVGLLDAELFLMVPRVNLGGHFVIVNMLATRRLFRELEREWTSFTVRLTGSSSAVP